MEWFLVDRLPRDTQGGGTYRMGRAGWDGGKETANPTTLDLNLGLCENEIFTPYL